MRFLLRKYNYCYFINSLLLSLRISNNIGKPFVLPILGSDHGVKANGDGWLLTVALIEGSGIVGAGTPGLPDSYVVFMCNGKKKTSSVKFQASEPKWNGKFTLRLIFSSSTLKR
jgi:hypothetical protein